MESLLVVKREPAAKPLPKIGTVVKRAEVDIVVLQRPPQSFDKDVVLGTASAVHTDGNAMVLEYAGEILTGKLGSLIGVEDFRGPVAADRLFQRLDLATK